MFRYFGTVLATGDFRYSPSLLDKIDLKSTQVDLCYLDNTYFNPIFSKIPTRDDALGQIISIIDQYHRPNVLFKILLKNLGKEKLLVDIVEYYRVPIVLSFKRYERLTKILEIDKKYFSVNFSETSFIFVDDEPINRCRGFLDGKKIIYIEPTGLKLADSEARCDTNFFRVPYSDHSSYTEIISFVRKIKPKKIIPIVRKMLPNEIDTTDMRDLEKYLNKEPIKDSAKKYSLLLQSSTSTRKSSRLKSISLNQSKTRVSTPITTRFITLRKRSTKKVQKNIEFETPTKQNPKRLAKSPKTILKSSQNGSEHFLKKPPHPSKLANNFLEPILEESRNYIEIDTDQEKVGDLSSKNNSKVSSDKENRKSANKWKKIDDNVELLIASDSDDPVLFEEKSSPVKNKIEKAVLKKFDPVVILERIDASKILIEKREEVSEQEDDILTSDESIYIENTIDEESNNNSWRIDTDFLDESLDELNDENLLNKNLNENHLFFDLMNENLMDFVIDPVEIGEQIRIHILDSFVF